MTAEFPLYKTLQERERKKSKLPVLEKAERECEHSVSVWKLTTLDGGTMAHNETNPFWEIMKSFNYGKCFCFVVCSFIP